MVQQLKDVGEAVSDVAIMVKIIASLSHKFNAVKTTWDITMLIEQQTVDNLGAFDKTRTLFISRT